MLLIITEMIFFCFVGFLQLHRPIMSDLYCEFSKCVWFALCLVQMVLLETCILDTYKFFTFPAINHFVKTNPAHLQPLVTYSVRMLKCTEMMRVIWE